MSLGRKLVPYVFAGAALFGKGAAGGIMLDDSVEPGRLGSYSQPDCAEGYFPNVSLRACEPVYESDPQTIATYRSGFDAGKLAGRHELLEEGYSEGFDKGKADGSYEGFIEGFKIGTVTAAGLVLITGLVGLIGNSVLGRKH